MFVPCGGNASNSYEGGSSGGLRGGGSGGVMVGLTWLGCSYHGEVNVVKV